MVVKIADADLDIQKDDLDERAARMAGPVTVTTMTAEDIAKYGAPKKQKLPECDCG